MAFYIELNKIHNNDDNFVYYSYEYSIITENAKNKAGKLRGKSKLVSGMLKINKTTGEVNVVENAEGDSGMYSQRATLTLIKHWKKGEYPDRTCWAS